MPRSNCAFSILRLGFIAVFLGGVLGGCSSWYNRKAPPPPTEYPLSTPYGAVRTFAIGPTVNLSPSHDFDPMTISDAMFAEMQQVGGLNILPVNKTLIAMQRLGMRSIESARDAQQLARVMGADGIIIPAVTAYDPYRPPSLGMTVQLYTAHTLMARSQVEARRIDGTVVATAVELEVDEQQPVSQVAAVFNSRNQTVLRELRDFTAGRTEYTSALQDEKFIDDMDQYTRFVCHAMVRRLIDVERSRLSDR